MESRFHYLDEMNERFPKMEISFDKMYRSSVAMFPNSVKCRYLDSPSRLIGTIVL